MFVKKKASPDDISIDLYVDTFCPVFIEPKILCLLQSRSSQLQSVCSTVSDFLLHIRYLRSPLKVPILYRCSLLVVCLVKNPMLS